MSDTEVLMLVYRGFVPRPRIHIGDANALPLCGTVLVDTQSRKGPVADVTCARCLKKKGK